MPPKSKDKMMQELRKRRRDAHLVKAEVHIPAHERERLARYVTTVLHGEYEPKGASR